MHLQTWFGVTVGQWNWDLSSHWPCLSKGRRIPSFQKLLGWLNLYSLSCLVSTICCICFIIPFPDCCYESSKWWGEQTESFTMLFCELGVTLSISIKYKIKFWWNLKVILLSDQPLSNEVCMWHNVAFIIKNYKLNLPINYYYSCYIIITKLYGMVPWGSHCLYRQSSCLWEVRYVSFIENSYFLVLLFV